MRSAGSVRLASSVRHVNNISLEATLVHSIEEDMININWAMWEPQSRESGDWVDQHSQLGAASH